MPTKHRPHYKGGRTEVISVRVTPALNAAMNSVAASADGETKSDLIDRAVRRLILIEYPDVAGANFNNEHC